MTSTRIGPLLRRIADGYLSLGKGIAVFLIALLAITASAAAIVFPVWYLAAKHSRAYSIGALALMAILAGYGLSRRVARDLTARAGTEPALLRILLHTLWRVLRIVLVASVSLAVLSLYSLGLFAFAVPATIVFLVGVGYLAFGRRSTVGRPSPLRR